jgi:hypothetical protein
VWPAPGLLVRAVLGLALAERVRPLFCGRGLPLLFLQLPGARGFLQLFVRPLDAYASPQPSCPKRATCELKRLFFAAAWRFATLRFRVAAAFRPAVLRMGLMFPPASSCGPALELKFIRHASTFERREYCRRALIRDGLAYGAD